MLSRLGLVAALALFAFLAAPAGATVIGLSAFTSEQEEIDMGDPGTPASVLLANFDFQVSGTTLTLEVTNFSDYDITELFFNVSSDITSLSIDSPPTDGDWALLTSSSPDGPAFGTFDFEVEVQGDINTSSATIQNGTSQTLTFTFTCGGTCDMDDFAVNNAAGAAVGAKFVNGGPQFGDPNDSAFGGSGEGFPPVPEPGTLVLLGAGLLGLGRMGNRRSA